MYKRFSLFYSKKKCSNLNIYLSRESLNLVVEVYSRNKYNLLSLLLWITFFKLGFIVSCVCVCVCLWMIKKPPNKRQILNQYKWFIVWIMFVCFIHHARIARDGTLLTLLLSKVRNNSIYVEIAESKAAKIKINWNKLKISLFKCLLYFSCTIILNEQKHKYHIYIISFTRSNIFPTVGLKV